MKLTINLDGVPEQLKNRDQWLGCTVTWNPDTQRYDKEPVGKWGDRSHWRTLADVIAAGQWPGFILADGVCSLDCDKCIGADGRIVPDAWALIQRLDSYTEYSLSGTGIHTFVFGRDIPPSVRSREFWSSGHWIAVTGQHVLHTPTDVNWRPDAVAAVAQELTVGATPTAPGQAYELPQVIPQGSRRHELFRYIRHLKSVTDKDSARQWLHMVNVTRCQPPVEENTDFERWFSRSWYHHDRPMPELNDVFGVL